MLNLTLPSAHSRLGTAGLMTGVHGRTPATAHTAENSHVQLRLRPITGHHASLCMSRSRLVLAPSRGGHTGAKEASRTGRRFPWPGDDGESVSVYL